MGENIENGLKFTAMMIQEKPGECWMVIRKNGCKIFYANYVKNNWSEQSVFQNNMARRIQRFFRTVLKIRMKFTQKILAHRNIIVLFNKLVFKQH